MVHLGSLSRGDKEKKKKQWKHPGSANIYGISREELIKRTRINGQRAEQRTGRCW